MNDSDYSAGLSWQAIGLGILVMLFLGLVYWDGLVFMLDKWGQEEYNHGYLIPVVALYLLWLRAERLNAVNLSGSWAGLLVVIGALAAFVLGELSSIYQIIAYGFLMAIFGVIVSAVGWTGIRIVWVPFVYLLFMVPLPVFIYQGLSSELQLISSQIGVAVIRGFGISVFLEGNVIDLGIYQLQVAEACSGLRYLFPLMSFGFLCAAIYLGPWWHRAIVFFSTIPITILMNSFRIGVIGILVDNWGIEQAEGFLHYFEGWVVFMVCVGILFFEMWILAKIGARRFNDVFGLDIPPIRTAMSLFPTRVTPQALASALMLGVGVVMVFLIQSREVQIPERATFDTFPLSIGDWSGRDSVIDDPGVLKSLAADDYFFGEYRNREDDGVVWLWVAYYEEQRKGRAVHSPRACLPGGGWQLESFDEYQLDDMGPNGEPYIVNRSVIAKGEMRQLVYYWFVERGRIQTNEYAVKWGIFWDALTRNRTDGALVRVTTFVSDVAKMAEADDRLEAYVRAMNPRLAYHLPQEEATFKQASAAAATE